VGWDADCEVIAELWAAVIRLPLTLWLVSQVAEQDATLYLPSRTDTDTLPWNGVSMLTIYKQS